MLGTGGAGSYERRGYPAYLVETDNTIILVDSGFGVDSKIRSLGFRVCDINAVLISHEHFDHLLGITGLLNMQFEEQCNRGLEVYGPQRAIETIPIIIEKTGPRNAPKPKLVGLDISYNKLMIGDAIVETIPVDHSVPTLGYSIESRGTRIVYSADTRPTDTIRDLAGKTQLLLHEASMPSHMIDIAIKTKHSTVKEAIDVGKNAEMIALIHIMHVAEDEARRASGKRVIVPVDGTIITIG